MSSVTSQVVAKGSNLLEPDETSMLETLQISREFMKLMREGHLSLRNLENFAEDEEEVESLNLSSFQLIF